MLDMLKHYTIEQLQETDIDLLLPLYRWYCKQFQNDDSPIPSGEKTVCRGGKMYKVVNPKDAAWA